MAGARQRIGPGNDDGTSQNDGWGYRGTIGPTFELNPMGAFRPYMGIYGGYITGKGAQDGPLVGPELGFKVGMGDQAYMDKDRFPTGPWCKLGDYVMFRSNSGTRFKVAGQEYRLMNDDSIEAVVKDPRGISRAY